jgi:methylated-DNA-[protein]-cysteine S-methyltransferase
VNLAFDQLETPIGVVVLAVHEDQLVMVDFADNETRYRGLLEKRFGTYTLELTANPNGFTRALQAYFAGDLSVIHNLPVDTGGTAFQARVWQTLKQIPAGETWSYLQLAQAIEQPSAVRAVGMTNGLNPISLVLPCHRVIGANGNLTGYAGGLQRKAWLLEFEANRAANPTAKQQTLF